MQDTPREPWIADIAIELEKIRKELETLNESFDGFWNDLIGAADALQKEGVKLQ